MNIKKYSYFHNRNAYTSPPKLKFEYLGVKSQIKRGTLQNKLNEEKKFRNTTEY